MNDRHDTSKESQASRHCVIFSKNQKVRVCLKFAMRRPAQLGIEPLAASRIISFACSSCRMPLADLRLECDVLRCSTYKNRRMVQRLQRCTMICSWSSHGLTADLKASTVTLQSFHQVTPSGQLHYHLSQSQRELTRVP